MGGLGTALGLIEVFGTAVVVVLLLAASRANRAPITAVVALAVLFGLVFANPFGLVARLSSGDPRPLRPTATADAATHWVKVVGVPVAWFTPYSQKYLYSGENSPTEALKIRYGFSFLPSTGASTVVGMCSNSITDPCWKSGRYPLIEHDAHGKPWVVPLTQTPFGVPLQYLNVPHFYEVEFGVVSYEAFLYWLVVAALVGFRATRSRVRWRRVGLAAAGSVAAGGVIAVTLAAAATPARSATDVEPKLIPKAKPVAVASASTNATAISDQNYGSACVEKEPGRTTYYCKRADQLTAVETGGGILALWTAQPTRDRSLQLRARRLTLTGKPLGSSHGVLPPWTASSSAKPGFVNCAQPLDLQAAPLPRGRVLVAWSDRCIVYDRTHADPIHGLVVDAAGHALGKPFEIVKVRPALSSEEAPEFALGSTTDGHPLLAWVAKPRNSEFGESIYASFLDGGTRATVANELTQQGGQMAIACTATCVVAIPNTTGVERLMFVNQHGKLGSTIDVPVGSGAINASAPTLAVRGNDFYVGWIESADAVSATAKIARVRPGGLEETSTVLSGFSTGQSSSPSTPRPLGIAFVGGEPALLWQVIAYSSGVANDQLYTASARGHTNRQVDLYLSEGSVPAPGAKALVAVGTAHFGQPDPISIPITQP